jgi:hypothetical protein
VRLLGYRRLADDPWVATRQLVTRSVDPWTILVSTEQLSSLARAVAPERCSFPRRTTD